MISAIASSGDKDEGHLPTAEIVSPSETFRLVADGAQSWPFRMAKFFRTVMEILFGMSSLIFMLAVISSVPVLNLLAFGYLFEITRRTALRQPFRQIMVGYRKGSFLGGILLGSWMILLPIRYLSHVAYEAQLVDPVGDVSSKLFVLRAVLVILLVAHVAAAVICGGKLKYFFWPVVAPFSLLVWSIRRMAGLKWFRHAIKITTEWIAPGLADDVCRVLPIKDWFLPAIFLTRMSQPEFGKQVWRDTMRFIRELRLPAYFRLGFIGFIGTLAWLIVPTLLLAGATLNLESSVLVPAALIGTLTAVPVFCLLPILQAHFSVYRTWSSFWQLGKVVDVFAKAPVWHFFAWLSIVLLSLPLFLLKIETIPQELIWTLSVVFWIFSLPARLVSGFAYGRSQKAERRRPWWLALPLAMLLVGVSIIQLLILTTTRYTSWNGALSLFENHLFLLPTPFWL